MTPRPPPPPPTNPDALDLMRMMESIILAMMSAEASQRQYVELMSSGKVSAVPSSSSLVVGDVKLLVMALCIKEFPASVERARVLEKTKEEMKKQNRRKPYSRPPTYGSWGSSSQQSSQSGFRRCSLCGKDGHFERDCSIDVRSGLRPVQSQQRGGDRPQTIGRVYAMSGAKEAGTLFSIPSRTLHPPPASAPFQPSLLPTPPPLTASRETIVFYSGPRRTPYPSLYMSSSSAVSTTASSTPSNEASNRSGDPRASLPLVSQ
ncbi:uncharacterized protein HKW66_Vig0105410 [Vigna angularis]|uniref:CCHC-type domain-containing protein n=1 Tax=Phaseolus angularis TaxID=3914 RepID=A0A8T0KIT5_PHAAN|nr:uncharacterized protein HKW66_Vig0105410 [Vigna angularis]